MHGNEMSLCDNLPEGDLGNVQGDLSPGWARRSGGGSAVAGRMGLDPRKVALKSPGDVRARDWRAGAADEWDLPPLSPLQLKIICSLHIEIGPTIQVQVMGSDKPSEQIWGSALSRKHLLGTQKTKPKALHVRCLHISNLDPNKNQPQKAPYLNEITVLVSPGDGQSKHRLNWSQVRPGSRW